MENSFNLSGSHSPHSSVHFVTIVFSHLGKDGKFMDSSKLEVEEEVERAIRLFPSRFVLLEQLVRAWKSPTKNKIFRHY